MRDDEKIEVDPMPELHPSTTLEDAVRACRELGAETLSFVGHANGEPTFAIYVVDGKRTRQIAAAFDAVIEALDEEEIAAMSDDEKRELLGEPNGDAS